MSRKNLQTRPQKPKTAKKLTLTPDTQALYFQCLAGSSKLDTRDEQTVLRVFDDRFPALKKQAAQPQRSGRRVPWAFAVWALAIVAVLLMLAHVSFAAVDADLIETARDHANSHTVPGSAFVGNGALATKAALKRYEQAADAQEMQAWTQGMAHREQPVTTSVRSDGAVVLSQNAPRQMVMRNGTPGLSDRRTEITVIQPAPIIQPTPRPLPTPLPTPVPKQETRIQTTVKSHESFETRAVLPEGLSVDQLDAVKKIAENGVIIGQQQIGLEQFRINEETNLARLKVFKGWMLWGMVVCLPLVYTLYFGVKGGTKALSDSRLRVLEKQLEIEKEKTRGYKALTPEDRHERYDTVS